MPCVRRSGLWEMRMSSPVHIFEIGRRPDLLQGGRIGTPAIGPQMCRVPLQTRDTGDRNGDRTLFTEGR